MIRIGVTGHRILTNHEKIKAGIRLVIDKITTSFPDTKWEIISSLAEGADCLFVEDAMKELHAKLIAVLPLPGADYLKEFQHLTNKTAFGTLLNNASEVIKIEQIKSKEESYLTAGSYIVNNCDILVAIWDGKKAQGIGGTGDIVELARQKLLPVAWIQAGNRRHGTKEPTDMGTVQGNIVYERFPNMKE